MLQKLAYSIKKFSDLTGLGRTAIFSAIKDERLRAKKSGRRTLILAEDAMRFLSNLPDAKTRGKNKPLAAPSTEGPKGHDEPKNHSQ